VRNAVSAHGLSEEDVRAVLEVVKRLREEEKLLEEMARGRQYYYLGYLPAILRATVNK